MSTSDTQSKSLGQGLKFNIIKKEIRYVALSCANFFMFYH